MMKINTLIQIVKYNRLDWYWWQVSSGLFRSIEIELNRIVQVYINPEAECGWCVATVHSFILSVTTSLNQMKISIISHRKLFNVKEWMIMKAKTWAIIEQFYDLESLNQLEQCTNVDLIKSYCEICHSAPSCNVWYTLHRSGALWILWSDIPIESYQKVADKKITQFGRDPKKLTLCLICAD